jgi:hypothetical protein
LKGGDIADLKPFYANGWRLHHQEIYSKKTYFTLSREMGSMSVFSSIYLTADEQCLMEKFNDQVNTPL